MIPFSADRAMVAKFDAAIAPFMSKVGQMSDGVKRFQMVSQVGFKEVEDRANRTGQALVNLRNGVSGLAVAGGAAALTGMALGLARLNDQAVAVDNQMRAIGITTDDLKKKVFALAIETRTPVEATVELLSRMQKSLQNQPLEQTIRQVGTLNRLLAIGGLDTNARASVSLQFGQALQSGVLQGDELRSLREAAPFELLDAIAKAAGGTVEQLRDLGSEGKLTKDVMVRALDDLDKSSRDKLGAFKMTLGDAATAMQTAMLAVVASANDGLDVYDTLVSAQSKVASFMLDNADAAETLGRALRMLLEAALLLAGTRGLMMLGGSLTAAMTGMTALRGAAILTTASMGALRGVLALMGGPVGLALFAAGAAFMYVQRSTLSVNEALERTDTLIGELGQSQARHSSLIDELIADMKRLKEAQEDVTRATREQNAVARAAAEVERQLAADRVENSRQLAKEAAAVTAAKLADLEASTAVSKNSMRSEYGGFNWFQMIGAGQAGIDVPAAEAEALKAFERAVDQKIAAGERLSAKEVQFVLDRQTIAEKEKEITRQRTLYAEQLAASLEKLSSVIRQGGDADIAEKVYQDQMKAAQAATRAVREMQAEIDGMARRKASVAGLQDQMEDLQKILESHQFDGDSAIRDGVEMVAAEVEKATKNVKDLDAEKLEALKLQVTGIIGVFDQFLERLGIVRKDLSTPYDLYNQYEGAFPGSTDRGSWQRNAQEAAGRGILDLIGFAEGTDKGRGYNETLGYGKFTGGDVDLVNMTLREVRELQRKMLAHPDNSFNSSALGRYQIVGQTLDGLVKSLGLSWDEQFTPGLQDRMAMQLVRGRRGQGVAGMRKEWASFEHLPGSTINTAIGAQPIDTVDAGVAERLKAELDTRKEFNQTLTDSAERRDLEISLIGKTAAEQAKAITRFELLNDAKRRGINLDEKAAGSAKTYREEIEALAEAAGKQADAQERYAKAAKIAEERSQYLTEKQRELKEGLVDAIIEGNNFSDVLANVAKSLAKAALQAALFNEGPFAGSKSGGGLLGGLFDGVKSLFGFANGGIMTGQGAATLPTRAYANGGIANSPQLALFGEGSMAEAYVPLPDGRTIPVTLRTPDLGAMRESGASIAEARGPQIQFVEVPYIVRVDADDGGKLMAHVERVSVQAATEMGRAVKASIPSVVKETQARPRLQRGY